MQRVPDRLHHDLINHIVSLPDFAGTRQKLIEVFVQSLTATAQIVTARGVIYTFDDRGFLNLKPLTEAAMMDLPRGPSAQANVIDLKPMIRRKRFASSYTWKPPADLIKRIKADANPARSERTPVPLLKPRRRDAQPRS
jgi:hypothetical protein